MINNGPSDMLLGVKVMMPSSYGGLVNRGRLLEKLGREPKPVSVVHAPAGFGKTTLLTSWLRQTGLPVAWLSLDENDNDPIRFTRYLLKSIAMVVPGFGEQLSKVVSSPQPPRGASLLSLLVNELEERLIQPIVIALDDYHLIENNIIHQLLDNIIEYRPACLHIAMTSRTQPPLPLPRLRVRRQLAEITEVDLRFNFDEAADFLNNIASLSLTDEDVAVLEVRTEGWIAGLQMAALSLESEQDRKAFIQAFAGDDRYILDYLTEEVLQRQPSEMKQFLLQTSILERLNGPLCDLVAETSNSRERLVSLEQSNMFLIPLDGKRNWYRYHHLFADLLRKQLVLGNQSTVKSLHLRASKWFSENDYPHEAIHHAFKAEDYEQAAQVLDRHGQQLFDEGQYPTLMAWYKCIPESYIHGNPRRTLQYAKSLFLGCGEIPHRLLEALQSAYDAGELALQTQELKAIEVDLALLGGFRAMQQRNIAIASEQAVRAVNLIRQASREPQLAVKMLYATVLFAKGDVVASEEQFARLTEAAFADEYLIVLNAAICGWGRSLMLQGRLNDAEARLTSCLRRMQEKGWARYLQDTAWTYLVLGALAYQRNQLDLSLDYLDQAMQAAKHDHWDTLPGMIAIHRARVFQAKGQFDEVEKCYQHIASLKIKPAFLHFFPDVEDDGLALSLARGEKKEPEEWMTEKSLLLDGELEPEKEFEYLLLARMQIASGRAQQASKLITSLLIAAEQGRRRQVVIELLILQALARQAQGQTKQAVDSLQCALHNAEEHGYIRLFLDEGAPLLALLKKVAANNTYAAELMALFDDGSSYSQAKRNPYAAIEPLSKKELGTLELVVAGLSNKEIAEQLCVSPNTVKTHIKNVYAKLGVNSRVQVIARAKELGL